MQNETYDNLATASSNYIRHYAQTNADIYKFMDKHNIGASAYGKIMDAAGRGKHVIAHRLYGHHIVYDFPYDNITNAADFLEHIGSDIFTKQGIPIIPGEILENQGLLKACDKLTNNWNFINGFDILAGTISIYTSLKHLRYTFSEEISIETFEDIAKSFGLGGLNFAIAMSTANPFLLIGAVLELTSSIKGFLNSRDLIFFKKQHESLQITYHLDNYSVEKIIASYSIEQSISNLSLENELKKITM